MSGSPPQEDPADLFDNAPCGYLSLAPDRTIVKLNRTLAGWLGAPSVSLVGRPFYEVLSFGGRMAFETLLAPRLRLSGSVDELALDLLHVDGSKVPVFANAAEVRDAGGACVFTRIVMFRFSDRRTYERALLHARDRAEAAASEEQEIAVLREQFIAVLGHDLRNPLAAIGAGLNILKEFEAPTEQGKRVMQEMSASVSRAGALIENVLDFARGRMGEGLILQRAATDGMAAVLDQVVAEMRAIAPEQTILSSFSGLVGLDCDHARVAQLASNLLGNAVVHGAPDIPIRVHARTTVERFELSVTNGGAPIPDEARARLFQPFFRGAVRDSQQGLGLGLFIVNEIAKAHGGAMEVTSTHDETRFTFSMPLVRH